MPVALQLLLLLEGESEELFSCLVIARSLYFGIADDDCRTLIRRRGALDWRMFFASVTGHLVPFVTTQRSYFHGSI